VIGGPGTAGRPRVEPLGGLARAGLHPAEELEPELLAGQRPPASRVGEDEVERGARVGRSQRRRRRHSRRQLDLRHGSVPEHLDLPAATAVQAEVALPLGERT
jgi:hypothetical protein